MQRIERDGHGVGVGAIERAEPVHRPQRVQCPWMVAHLVQRSTAHACGQGGQYVRRTPFDEKALGRHPPEHIVVVECLDKLFR